MNMEIDNKYMKIMCVCVCVGEISKMSKFKYVNGVDVQIKLF